jgi:PilZ domain-containing protein
MSANVTVLIADPERLATVRDLAPLEGRVMSFVSSDLVLAFDSIKTNHPGLVAIDGEFAETDEGRALIDRIDKLSIEGSQTRIVARLNGEWATIPLPSYPGSAGAAAAPKVDVKAVGLNTRRTPRFPLAHPLQAVVDHSKARLVDLSVLGAQVISTPVLRPHHTIHVALPDVDEPLRVTADICWAVFEERPEDEPEPYYRAGMEFTETARPALEEYCRRYCAQDPLPLRRH